MPLLQVTLLHSKNRIDLDCLVDSGAGDCIFSKDIAEIRGIDIGKGEPRDYEGIGGAGMTGYLHQVKLRPKGFSKWITVEAGFIDHDDIPLLGQSGFFDSYEVTFRAYKNQFEIKSKGKG